VTDTKTMLASKVPSPAYDADAAMLQLLDLDPKPTRVRAQTTPASVRRGLGGEA
jgi:hypothetical protein